MSTLQHNIRAFRLKVGYTQEEVAAVIGVARPKYTEYETREVDIPEETIEKLSRLYGTEADILRSADAQSLKNALVCTYLTEAYTGDDKKKIDRFNRIVGTYIRMLGRER